MRTIVGVFPSDEEAKRVAHHLKTLGIPPDAVAIASATGAKGFEQCRKEGEWSERNIAAVGVTGFGWIFAGMIPAVSDWSPRRAAIFGAVLVGIAGLAMGLIALGVRGGAPVIAGSASLTVLVPMCVGALLGGFAAALYRKGVSHQQTPLCQEAEREHGVVVAAHVDEDNEVHVLHVMNEHHARNLRCGADAWVASGSSGRPDEGEQLYPSDSSVKSHCEYRW